VCISIGNSLIAQNLVPNGGFEEYGECPGNYSQAVAEFRVRDWFSAGTGTPDHFHSCSAGDADVPHNWAGVSAAFEGQGYAGIFTWVFGKDYREYLQSKLTEPLIADSTYIIQFRYKLSSYSMYAVDRIGVRIENSFQKVNHDKIINANSLSIISDSALTEQTGLWEKAKFEYKAKGGEHVITIGNFYKTDETSYYQLMFQPMQQDMLESAAYYYIDDVSVSPKYLPEIYNNVLVDAFQLDVVVLNKAYVLNNINFEFNSYKLLNSSFEELDALVDWLKQNPKIIVQLSGHTDDVGGDRYNLSLSKNRAKTVGEYLITQGIDAKRIESFGYGKSKPLINEKSDPARKINRRVEVKFVQ
jgi:OmpA-OmpF porin, OOP family